MDVQAQINQLQSGVKSRSVAIDEKRYEHRARMLIDSYTNNIMGFHIKVFFNL